jgi:hypothetical protein
MVFEFQSGQRGARRLKFSPMNSVHAEAPKHAVFSQQPASGRWAAMLQVLRR